MEYGYARVSTREQNEERQIFALKRGGISEANIFVDKASGKDFERSEYKKLVRRLKKGDVLVIKSIDRLGRNYNEILDQWRILTREKKISIVVLDMPLLDTRKTNDLTGTLIADVVLQLLSYVAETEKVFIRQRQKEGIEAARARGVRFGRMPMEKPQEYEKYKFLWEEKKISARSAGKNLGVTHQTFLRWVRTENNSMEKNDRYG